MVRRSIDSFVPSGGWLDPCSADFRLPWPTDTRILGVGDAFGAPDMVLNNSLSSLNEYVFVTSNWLCPLGHWHLGTGLMLLWGRWFRAGLGLRHWGWP